jgi:hypothetical protein
MFALRATAAGQRANPPRRRHAAQDNASRIPILFVSARLTILIAQKMTTAAAKTSNTAAKTSRPPKRNVGALRLARTRRLMRHSFAGVWGASMARVPPVLFKRRREIATEALPAGPRRQAIAAKLRAAPCKVCHAQRERRSSHTVRSTAMNPASPIPAVQLCAPIGKTGQSG